MNLHRMLQQRAAEDKPLRIGLIGAGKFGADVPRADPDARRASTCVGIADLSPDARAARTSRGRLEARASRRAGSFAEATQARQHAS